LAIENLGHILRADAHQKVLPCFTGLHCIPRFRIDGWIESALGCTAKSNPERAERIAVCGRCPDPTGMIAISMAEGDPIRIIPHRGVDDDCGSLEVWFADGRKSVRYYWDNLVSRRLNPSTLTR
jgi:hypothetical protein